MIPATFAHMVRVRRPAIIVAFVVAQSGCQLVDAVRGTSGRDAAIAGGADAMIDAGVSTPAEAFTVRVVPAEPFVIAGSEALVTVEIVRSADFMESVEIRLSDLPEGVTAEPIVLDTQATIGSAVLIASADAPVGSHDVHVVGTASDAPTVEIEVALSVRQRPASGTLDDPLLVGAVSDGFVLSSLAAVGDGRVFVAGRLQDGSEIVALNRYGGIIDSFATDGVLTLPGLRVTSIAARDGLFVLGNLIEVTPTGKRGLLQAFTFDGTPLGDFGQSGRVAIRMTQNEFPEYDFVAGLAVGR